MRPIPVEDFPRGGMAALTKKYATAVAALEASIGGMNGLTLAVAREFSNAVVEAYRRQANPYLQEIYDLHRCCLFYPMNGSLDYGCSAGGKLMEGRPVLWRALDWPWDGMGNSLLLVKMPSSFGRWVNVTWPNFVGVATALAPGRFALAVNRAPHLGQINLNLQRIRVMTGRHLSPLHFARLVMETAPDFDTARQMLQTTRLNTTAIFTLVGCKPGELCIIEHQSNKAKHSPEGGEVVCATNHWQFFRPGLIKAVPDVTLKRLATMRESLEKDLAHAFGWLVPPVLNVKTRVAVEACPATGRLRVRGVEGELLVTAYDGQFEAA